MDKSMQDAVVRVAKSAHFEPAALLAVVEIESMGKAFEIDGTTPCLLFERHIFYRQLKKLRPGFLATATVQGLTRETWDRATQYKDEGTSKNRLALIAKARAIDEECANLSASWGVGQTMGFNAKECGFDSATEMVQAMASIQVQIEIMVKEINVNKSAAKLRARDWVGFARIYNGAGYAQNRYDVRLAAAYDKWVKALDPADPETGEERVVIPISRAAEPAPMTQSNIGNGSIVSGGAVATGAGALITEKVLDKASDKASDAAGVVIDHANTVIFSTTTTLAISCFAIALGACVFIWWQRLKLKKAVGV